MEYFRIDESGRVSDTQDRLTGRGIGGSAATTTRSLPVVGWAAGRWSSRWLYPNQSGPYSNGTGPDTALAVRRDR